ncbi:hypothetical protein NSQ38_29940 [Paenibacillus sp. FSL R7-0313]
MVNITMIHLPITVARIHIFASSLNTDRFISSVRLIISYFIFAFP